MYDNIRAAGVDPFESLVGLAVMSEHADSSRPPMLSVYEATGILGWMDTFIASDGMQPRLQNLILTMIGNGGYYSPNLENIKAEQQYIYETNKCLKSGSGWKIVENPRKTYDDPVVYRLVGSAP